MSKTRRVIRSTSNLIADGLEPVVFATGVSVSEAPGTAHVLADQAVFFWTSTIGLQIQWSETSNATDFSQNLTRARCEGRFGTSALSPLGVVSCDLTV
jgi:hypothetical protein